VRDRNANRAALADLISARTREKPREFWLSALPAAGVPCSGLNTIDKVFEEPQVQARGMRIEVEHPLAGPIPNLANPIKFSGSELRYKRAAPLLGEHTDEVLKEWLGD
jgi:crotonobetainyl-CoA:carnitine CoA-transferase CaiB-like acyl-CoA transferase